MAAPMRDGAPAGGPRPDHANFEYDDNEWDVGIGDLIIDLDADIEKTDGGMASAPGRAPDTPRSALKMKIKRTKPGTKTSEAKHEIVKSNEVNGEPRRATASAPAPAGAPSPAPPASPLASAPPVAAPLGKRASGGHRRERARDKHALEANGAPPPQLPPAAPQPPQQHQPPPDLDHPPPPLKKQKTETKIIPPTVVAMKEDTGSTKTSGAGAAYVVAKEEPAPVKKRADVCVGTSVGTITEPDCLGPCEPGTSVTLEGIVWHETEGGVLVVNVTWRGKTYVGTLLDCTRHDWAPPRFCDSPTEELEARTPKGRGKRARATPGDLANFTETRSSVHSKLRNGGGKTRRAQGSPTPFAPPRIDAKRKARTADEETSAQASPAAGSPAPCPSKQKRVISAGPAISPPASPALLECPEPNCSKKYKHINGLKYHRSHAHGSPDDDDTKDAASCSENDESPVEESVPGAPLALSAPLPSAESPEKVGEVTSHKDDPTSPRAQSPLRFAPLEEPQAPVTPLSPTPRAPPSPPSPVTPAPSPALTPAPLVDLAKPPPALAPGPHFKVKTTASLMPAEEKKSPAESPPVKSPLSASIRKSKNRKSPSGSPAAERVFGPASPARREDVTSPAYSDISDDAAPADGEAERGKLGGEVKKGEPGLPHSVPPGYGVYQFYGQPPYLVSPQPAAAEPPKHKEETVKTTEPKSGTEPPNKRDGAPEGIPAQKMLPQHFYPYPYSHVPPGFPYGVEAGYGALEDKHKEATGVTPPAGERSKASPGPAEMAPLKPVPPPSQPVPRLKPPDAPKEKHSNENHQIIKESIEMKSQMSPYMFQRQQQAHHQREEEMRRYYMSLEQRRKEGVTGPDSIKCPLQPSPQMKLTSAPPAKGPLPKETKLCEDGPKPLVKEEPKGVKQEGQKPTMETTGPPPPPTSQYYLHPSYMQPPHYGALPFDPVYRGGINPMLVSGPFGAAWGGVGLPRYHAPEDLSRPPPSQSHAQYFPGHKIHELQERALKSPTPKGGGAPGGAGAAGPPPAALPPGKAPAPPDAPKEPPRSPPPQRHVHTHHHTHVGLGYPIYPAPYPAAVLASQQAAAVTVVNSFPTTK